METIIAKFEEGKRKDELLTDIEARLAWACYYTKESGNKVPDFEDCIWDEEIEGIVRDCKKYGIKEITISSNMSGMANTIARFVYHGCKLEGMTKVNSRFNDYITGEKEVKNAFRISI